MNFFEIIFTVIFNIFKISAAKLATFFGSTSCVVKLSLIDTSSVNIAPDEQEYKSELEELEQRRKVLKPILVSVRKDLTNPKPFILTEGGNAVYKALEHKGMQRGPINLE